MSAAAAHASLERLFRDERPRIVATLARATRDLEVAEDALQDALVAAATAWARDGVPADPVPWIYVVARRRAIDRLRRARPTAGLEALERLEATDLAAPGGLPDERLELIFACCHPTLRLDARVALTLRAFGGLSTEEIAGAFLVTPATMGQRIARAKAKLRDVGVPFSMPAPEALPSRLDAVLAVVYLVFNEGYAATADGPRVRASLCDEALRLARLLAVLLPDEPEALGLAALMLFHDARRTTRVGDDGVPVGLDEQDRSRWDRAAIAEADGLLERALAAGRRGPYLVQACIASLHAQAPRAQDTDWAQITALYVVLAELRPGPAVALAHAAALGMAAGPEAGLQRLAELQAGGSGVREGQAEALRAELLRHACRDSEAREAYRAALARTGTAPERAYLRRRLSRLTDTPAGAPRTAPAPGP